MIVQGLAFYLFAIIAVLSGVMVISARNPVHSVLFLILAFFNAAGLFVLMGAEFLAMILVVVYVGAVAVMFLFVVMMLDINLARLRERFAAYLPVSAAVAALMALELILVFGAGYFGTDRFQSPAPRAADYSNTAALGSVLYTRYVYPFEIAAVILLVAIVAAIALAMRGRRQSKYLNPASQVAARKADRVRLVKMPGNKEP
jgi:NADH-quinone oxidoreductase subunit J